MTSNIQQYRNVPDLIEQIKRLEKRIAVLETSKRIGSSSVDSGSLIINDGDLIIKDASGSERIRLTRGVNPSVYQRAANATDEARARAVAFEQDGKLQYQLYVVRDSDGAGDGGKLLLTREYAYLSHQPASGEETFIGLSAYAAYDNHFLFRGKWISDNQFADWNAVFMGTAKVESGFSGYAHTYDYPYPTTPLVLYSVTGNPATFTHSITATSTTGFTVTWSGTAAHDVNYLILRR